MRYSVAPLIVTKAQLALAPTYGDLETAWDEIKPGTVLRDDTGRVVASDAGMLPWLNPSNIH